MPANYGRRPFQTTGYDVQVSADGRPEMKIGGITLDYNSLPQNNTGSALTLVDQTIVQPGAYYLLFGTTLCRITSTATDTVTITGTPTGGTFTVSVTTPNGTVSTAQTTTAIAYNATGATLQTAILALSNVGAGNATVTGSAGGPYTLTFAQSLGPVTVTASGASLTGGTSPAATAASTAPGGNTGLFGAFNSSGTTGVQTLTPGDCFVLNKTWLDTAVPAFPNQGTAHPAVFDGGRVDLAKLVLSTGQGGNSLPSGYPAGPTISAFRTAFPRISFVND